MLPVAAEQDGLNDVGGVSSREVYVFYEEGHTKQDDGEVSPTQSRISPSRQDYRTQCILAVVPGNRVHGVPVAAEQDGLNDVEQVSGLGCLGKMDFPQVRIR